VDETMKNLEVRFDPGGYNYQSVTVQVTNKQVRLLIWKTLISI
jgi:hypothetical protein